MLAQLYAQRERQAAQARAEAVARADLEAMVLRIEHHFKARSLPCGHRVPWHLDRWPAQPPSHISHSFRKSCAFVPTPVLHRLPAEELTAA